MKKEGEAFLVIVLLTIVLFSVYFIPDSNLLTGYSVSVQGVTIHGVPPTSTNVYGSSFLEASDGSSASKTLSCSEYRCSTSTYLVFGWNLSIPDGAVVDEAIIVTEHKLISTEGSPHLSVQFGDEVLGTLDESTTDVQTKFTVPFSPDAQLKIAFSVSGDREAYATALFDTVLYSVTYTYDGTQYTAGFSEPEIRPEIFIEPDSPEISPSRATEPVEASPSRALVVPDIEEVKHDILKDKDWVSYDLLDPIHVRAFKSIIDERLQDYNILTKDSEHYTFGCAGETGKIIVESFTTQSHTKEEIFATAEELCEGSISWRGGN